MARNVNMSDDQWTIVSSWHEVPASILPIDTAVPSCPVSWTSSWQAWSWHCLIVSVQFYQNGCDVFYQCDQWLLHSVLTAVVTVGVAVLFISLIAVMTTRFSMLCRALVLKRAKLHYVFGFWKSYLFYLCRRLYICLGLTVRLWSGVLEKWVNFYEIFGRGRPWDKK